MKTIFIFNDLHGNVSALKALINEINNIKPDYIFSTGDLIGIGPNHNEVLEIITKLNNFYTVKGNHESYYVDNYRSKLAALENAHHDWIHSSMNPKYDNYLRTIPYLYEFNIEGLKIALTHYQVINGKYGTIQKDKSYEYYQNLFEYLDSDIIIFGHDHYENIYVNNKTFIDIGSSGCNNSNVGFTKYGILTIDNKKFNISTHLIKCDVTYERNKLDEYNVPDKEYIKDNFIKK